MTELNLYLASHYLNEAQLATAAALRDGELDALIGARLIPSPSYVVTPGTLSSFVFGDMAAPGATPGRYFHPSLPVWIARARAAVSDGAGEAELKAQFGANFACALATLNLSTWRLRDSFGDDGAPIVEGLRVRTENAWTFFLNGTFGLCVAQPISEAHIAYKEVLQEKLTAQSDNGKRTAFTPQQALAMHEMIDAYAAASMPFSPVEYARSSRKRLVADMRAALDPA